MSFSDVGDREYGELVDDLRLGFGNEVDVRMVATHSSKSHRLPIVAAEREGWNTSVAWYANNFHNHYTAFRFKRAIAATWLFPICGVFGRKHMSGHEADCPLPDLTNFQKDYWNRRPLEGFACFAGGWHLATTLRYLEAVSKLNERNLYDLVMDKTNYGPMDTIDGNAFDFVQLCALVGIPAVGSYDKDVQVPPNKIVKSMRLDWYGVETDIRPTCVEVEPMPGVLLPAPTGCGDVFVEPLDTHLGERLDDSVQLRWSEETKYKDPRMLGFVPTKMFRYFSRAQEDYRARKAKLDATPWRACGAYNATTLDTKLFRFEIPNQLDAALFVKWWLCAGIPCAEEALAKKEKTDVAHRQPDS